MNIRMGWSRICWCCFLVFFMSNFCKITTFKNVWAVISHLRVYEGQRQKIPSIFSSLELDIVFKFRHLECIYRSVGRNENLGMPVTFGGHLPAPSWYWVNWSAKIWGCHGTPGPSSVYFIPRIFNFRNHLLWRNFVSFLIFQTTT